MTIAANVLTAPVTVLYGASGVGKSSLLMAGVAPFVRQQKNTTVVLFRSWQQPDLIRALNRAVAEAVRQKTEDPVDESEGFDVCVASAVAKTKGAITIIFDQFEEFLLYHAMKTEAGAPLDRRRSRLCAAPMKFFCALLLLAGCAISPPLVPAVAVNDAHVTTTEVAAGTSVQYAGKLFPLVSACGMHAGADAGSLIVFDSAGAEKLRLPLSDAARFALSDDCRTAILQDSDRRAVRVHDLQTGSVLHRFNLGEYVTDLAGANGEWIVYTYPTRDRQGAFRILNAEGGELSRWEIEPESTFDLVEGKILTMGAGGFTLHSTRGDVVQQFAVSSAERFAHPLGAHLSDGRWVFVAAGDGYFPYRMVTVFSADGTLLYQEIADGRADSVLASGNTFVLRDANRAWKYVLP